MKNYIGAIVLVVLMLAGCKGGNESYLDKKWEPVSLNNGQVSIESPFTMKTKDVSKEIASVKQYIKTFEMKISPESYNNFLILLSAVEYVDQITADYKNAADNAVKSAEKEGKMSNFVYTTADVTLDGKEGVEQTGTFKFGGKVFNFKQRLYGYKNKMVQILVASPEKDAAGATIMERVLKSLSIK